MSWSSRRQFGILAALAGIVAVPVALVGAYLLWERPTCDDGILNGEERGVDCGGSCSLVCTDEANPATVAWVRAFPVGPGRYNVVAMVENPNVAARADGLRYRVRVYDADDVAVAERVGEVDLDPRTVVPVVELGLDAGERAVTRASLEWLDDPLWVQAEGEPRVVVVVDERIERQGAEPRARASVQNTGVLPVGKIAVVAVAYGADGNAVAATRTWVERLAAGESREVVFAWSAPWPSEAEDLQVVLAYDAPQ